MEIAVIIIVSLLGSALTFFSGFGLGTILLPVFAMFFPIDIAIALTAIVHFLNNFFKLILVGKNINPRILLLFGLPSILASFIGAYLLKNLMTFEPIFQNEHFNISPINLIISILLIFFALFEILPMLKKLEFDKKYLPLGGLLSGFFGGLSGHQGALRSAFLIRAGLSKEQFIATGVAVACLVDISRLSVYSQNIIKIHQNLDWSLVTYATISAFVGAYLGNQILKKVTINTIQKIVVILLIIFAIYLGLGIH